jgi:hypothetical protein
MAVDAISSAFQSRIIEGMDGHSWSNVRPRVENMLSKVENRTTLFLGAAVSSFKPTCFPAWEKFIEFVYSALVDSSTENIELGSEGKS